MKHARIVSACTLYGGTYCQFKVSLPRLGIQVKFAQDDDPASFDILVDHKTKALYVETLGNPKVSTLVIGYLGLHSDVRVLAIVYLFLFLSAAMSSNSILFPSSHRQYNIPRFTELKAVAKKHGIPLIVDNTFGGCGAICRPIQVSSCTWREVKNKQRSLDTGC